MIQSLGLLLALQGASGAYGLPEEMTVQVSAWGSYPGQTFRAGDIGLSFGTMVPGGDTDCRFTIFWSAPDTDIPALGAPIIVADAFGAFRAYRVSNVDLVLFYQGSDAGGHVMNAAQVTGQGYSSGLSEKRYGNASTQGASSPLSSDAVTFPAGTATGTIIATAVGQLGNGVLVGDPGVTGSGPNIDEVTADLRGRTALDVINEYAAYDTRSWQVTGDNGSPTFRLVTKGQNGTYVGSLPDLAAGDGFKVSYGYQDIETEFAVQWRDAQQHDAVEVTIVEGNGNRLWPNGIGFTRQKWIDAGNSARSLAEAASVAAQYAGNAVGIAPVAGTVAVPWPVMLTGPNGEQYPPWRIPANAYLRCTNFATGTGYLQAAQDFFIVKSEWHQDELRQILTIGVLQTEMKRLRQAGVITPSRIGTAPPGVSVNQAPQFSNEKGVSGGYTPLDSKAVAWNDSRTPPSNLPVRANHKNIPYVIDAGSSVIETGKTGIILCPFTCHLHLVDVVSDQSCTATVQLMSSNLTYWQGGRPGVSSSQGPASLLALTPDIQVALTASFAKQQTTASGVPIDIQLKQGDYLAFNVISNDLSQRLSINLTVTLDPEEPQELWAGLTGDTSKRATPKPGEVV